MMVDIHPNDIGLATYKEVGDVEKLKTKAKVIVDAINEIYTTGGGTASGGGSSEGNTQAFEQIYVDGENNIIIGENNIVYGNNNFIIGSNNIINANNFNLIGSGYCRYQSCKANFFNVSVNSNTIGFYLEGESNETSSLPFDVGDKVIFSLSVDWISEDYMENKTTYIPLKINEIVALEYDASRKEGTITLESLSEYVIPPSETCNIINTVFINTFFPLNSNSTLQCKDTAMSFGGEATGDKSFVTSNAKATGFNAFAVNAAKAESSNAAAFGTSHALGQYSFSANSAKCEGSYSAAFNASYNGVQNSLSLGYNTMTISRALKAVSMDTVNKKITLESGQDTRGIVGKKIVIRCYNAYNSYIIKEGVVDAIEENVLTLSGLSFNSYNVESLFPDKYVFVEDASSTYAISDVVSGYQSIATSKYTFAHGQYVTAAQNGSVIFGKYGTSEDEFSLNFANGTSLTEQGIAFKVLLNGRVCADGAYSTPCADYAELFEWADSNPDEEDRVGYFVRLEGEKIVKCSEFDTPIGIVSAAPAIIGDSGELHWKNKFVTDDFGRVQYHDVVIPEEKDDDGNILTEEHIEMHPVINPEWNCDEEYVPRNKRSEWSAVGVLGKLVVYDDGTLKPGDICRCGNGGIAVKSVRNGYQVLKRISDDKVLIWFRG